MTEILKRSKGKSSPLTIDSRIQKEIQSYKRRLLEMAENDEVRPIDKVTINIILNDLEPYDQYLLLAFYALPYKPTELSKFLNISNTVITSRINKIIKYVRDRSNSITNNSGVLG